MSSRIGTDGLIFRLLAIVAACALPLSAFGKDNIQTYRIPKESTSKNTMPPAAPEGAKPAEKPLAWTLPPGWQEADATGVRVASFIVPGKNGGPAELAVMPFAGRPGGELSNVNRWRREVGLDLIEEQGITSEKVQVGADSAKLYEIVGPKEETLVAWLYKDETSWFFKLRGDKNTVSDAKPAMIEFLKSIRFLAAPSLAAANSVADTPGANPHAPALPAGHPAIGGSEANASSKMPEEKNPNLPTWQVPASWKEQPAPRMVIKSFAVGDDSHKAVITISSFPGDVGGLLANVNRWRAQLGLEGLAETDLGKSVQPLDTANGKASIVQMDAASKPVRLVGVILPHGTDTWFYKMVGDASAVDKEKENLLSLVQSARYP